MSTAWSNVRRHGGLVLAGLVVGAAVAGALTVLSPTTYTSTTKLFVTAAHPVDSMAAAYEGNLFTQQRMTSYAHILTSPQLAQRVVNDLGLSLSPEALAGEVTATAAPDTVVLTVTVTDRSAQHARDIADSLGRQFSSEVAQLEQPDGATASTVEVRTIQSADLNLTPAGPDLTANLWRGAAVGLVIGLLLALLRARFDDRVRFEDDLAPTGAAVVGRAQDDRQLTKVHVLGPATLRGPSGDGFRALAAGLQQTQEGHRRRVVLVTGSLPGVGASTVAANVALSMARLGARVLLVDADLQRPRAARYLGLPDGPGLTEALTAPVHPNQVIHRYGDEQLWVLPAGGLHPNPGDLLGSARMSDLLGEVGGSYDCVVLDAPPVLGPTDAELLATHADTTLLVVRYGHTRRSELVEAVDELVGIGGPVPGVVVNRVPPGRSLRPGGRRAYRPAAVRPTVARQHGVPVGTGSA